VPISHALAAAVARLAGRQHGTVARWQLIALGMTDSDIARWVKQGRLHRLLWGVYLVGHSVPPPLAMEQAALLACHNEAILTHRTGCVLWGFLAADDGPVHVTTRRHRGRPKGVVVHTTTRLERRDTTRRFDLPITTPARTLLDLAETAAELERAVEQAFALKRVTERQLRDVIRRYPGRRGAKVLAALLDYRGDTGFTRSAAEDILRRLLKAAHLPQPAVNARLHGYEVDFYWPEHKLIVEVDSWQHHADRRSFEHDRAKRADLQARGYTVLPITARQLTHEPEATIARIAAAIALASAA
jgi:very-short-patch-repair endonuclease